MSLYTSYFPAMERHILHYYSDSTASIILKNECYFKVGDGKTIKIWASKWLQVGTSQSCFSWLYDVSTSKTVTVVEMGDFRADSWHWNFRWNWRLRFSDQTQLKQFFILLDGVRLSTRKENLRWWAAESTEQYTVKSCSLLIDKAEYLDTFIFTKLLWKLFPSPRLKS